ncbi:hypothetical protein GOP47_0029858 [Adiantum capillus-veneris]|nr:hypothetical protein GOP47_0029858 [Adiantum capillus-veneris]
MINEDLAVLDYAALYAACGLSEENVETMATATAAAASGGKTQPCTKFFSTSGCPYGESCHCLHVVPGGIAALGMQVMVPPRGVLKHQQQQVLHLNDPSLTVNGYKTRLCNRFNTSEGCRFADNCHFAHGEADLRRPNFACKLPTTTTSSSSTHHLMNLLHPPGPPSHNIVHATMLQSADAAYNTVATSYNPTQTTAAPGDDSVHYNAPYTTASCSFTYPSSITSSSPCPLHLYNAFPPSTAAYSTSATPFSANSIADCVSAEPTPPGVTVPVPATYTTSHEAALMTA